MLKYNTILVLVCSLLISCGAPKPGAGTIHTSLPSVSPTETEERLPTVTPTPTLPPDPVLYQFDDNVTQRDQELVKEQVRLARYYMINNLGSDLNGPVKIMMENDPQGRSTSIVYGRGYFFHDDTCGTPHEPCFTYNVASLIWQGCGNEDFVFRCLNSHELVHAWQFQHGCGGLWGEAANPLTGFVYEGMAEYMGFLATGFPEGAEDFSKPYAFSFWPAVQFDENQWFGNNTVAAVAVKGLVDQHGTMAFAEFCDAEGHGAGPEGAFQSVFGVSIQDFREQFMNEVLGQAVDCTPATCGTGDVIGQYSIKEFVDPARKEPNLIARFVDEAGAPVVVSNIILCRQTMDLPSACRQPENVPGLFSGAILSGRYAFYFCPPGYPGTENTGYCKGHETAWFDVPEVGTTDLIFQVPAGIEMPDLPAPDLIVNISDADGNPVEGMFVQICNYDSPVKVCTSADKGLQTTSDGMVEVKLRSGNYLLRLAWPSAGYGGLTKTYEIRDIVVDQAAVKSVVYQFPPANLRIIFKDAVGSSLVHHDFVLCRAVEEQGNCLTPASLWGWWVNTNDQGVFEANVPPGDYLIVTNRDFTSVEQHVDLKIPVTVTGDSEVTTIEVPLSN